MWLGECWKICTISVQFFENAFVLPTPSYGLKLIERFAGYKRKLTGSRWKVVHGDLHRGRRDAGSREGGRSSWARSSVYNEEDLDALWFVYRVDQRTELEQERQLNPQV